MGMKKPIFTGVCTALITPLNNLGVDYEKLKYLLLRQIKLGISAVLVCGTTGEAPTLTDYQHKKIIEYSVNVVKGKIPVIAGTGSNSTKHAVLMSKFAKSVGANASLLVTPYYNKSTQDGLIKHYFEIFDSVNLPFIIYNVPSRTGVNIDIDTYQKLMTHPHLYGIKECNDSLKHLNDLLLLCDDMPIYSGDDQSFLPFIMSGGKGIISVISNLLPDKMCKIVDFINSGDIKGAKQMLIRYQNLINLMFKAVNPIPIKYAMSKAKLCDNRLIAPLFKLNCDKNIDYELQKLKGDIIL